MNFKQTLAAGEKVEFNEAGDFFRLLSCPFAVELRFYMAGKEVGRAEEVTEGFAERFRVGGFDRVALINGATGQTVQAVVRGGSEVAYDQPPTGNVRVTNTGGAFAQQNGTVGAASVVIANANALRRYFYVENKHASATLYVNLSGAAATVAGGVTLLPGESLELQGYVPTGAIAAIASAAGTTFVMVEG